MNEKLQETKEIRLDKLIPFQLRSSQPYQGARLEQLMNSIERLGLQSPITVRPTNDGKYEIICGHNRANAVRACLISSDEDGNEGESKNLSRNNEFTLTIFPKPAEFVQPAEKALYHPTTRQHNKSV